MFVAAGCRQIVGFDDVDPAPPDPAAAAWGCLAARPRARQAPPSLTLRVPLINGADDSPVVGADVTACGEFAERCSTPVATGESRGDGVATLLVEGIAPVDGFTGYFEVAIGGAVPSLVFRSPAPFADTTLPPTPLVARSWFPKTPAFVGNGPSPGRGHVQLMITDCHGRPAAGVSFHIDATDERSTSFYGRLANANVAGTETSTHGSGGVVNLPEGVTAITAVLASNNAVVAETSVVIRAGALTFVNLGPPGAS